MTFAATNFTGIDWAIAAVYLAVTIGIGLCANRLVRDMADYVVAGRSLRSFISIATMLGSEIGLVTVMYTAQKGFTSGFAAFHIGVLAGLGCLVVGLTGLIVVPLRRTGVMTIPEYYGQRFGTPVRVLGGVILAIAGLLNMGVFLKAGAIFVAGVTGVADPFWIDMIMVLLIAVVLLYTILGGMVSVVITDYIQFVILSAGLLICCGYSLNHFGWDGLVIVVEEVHGRKGFDPLAEGGFGADYVLWMFFTFGLVSCAVWPTAAMRVCSAESTLVVRRIYIWSSIGFMTRVIIPQFLGICALAFLWTQPDWRTEFFHADGTLITEADRTLQALPTYLAHVLPTGLLGLITAGMLAAFMSTHDSYLLCWASVLVEDVINPLAGGQLTMASKLRLARVLIFCMGVFLLVWSLWYPMRQEMLDYMAVSGAIYFTGAFAVLLGGLYWPRTSRCGAVLALLTGGFAVLGLTPVQEIFGLEDKLKDSQVGLSVSAAALVMLIAGSLLVPDRKPGHIENTDKEAAG